MCGFRLHWIVILFLSASTGAWSQSVRKSDTGITAGLRKRTKQAEKAGYVLPEILDGSNGYLAIVTAHYRNFDVLLITSADIKLDDLLNTAKQVATNMGYPKCDFIIREGTASRLVDLEFNDYINFGGSWYSEAQNVRFPVGKFAHELKSSILGKHDWQFVFDHDNVDSFALTHLPIKLPPDSVAVVSIGDIPANAAIEVTMTMSWTHKVVGWICTGGPFILLLMTVLSVFRTRNRDAKQTATELDVETIQDPVERQELYNKGSTNRWTVLIGILPLLMFGGVTLLTPVLKSDFFEKSLDSSVLSQWLSQLNPRTMIFGMVVIFAVVVGIPIVSSKLKRRNKLDPDDAIEKPKEPFARQMNSVMLLMPLVLLLLLGMSFIPALRRLDPALRMMVFMSPALLMMLLMPIILMRASLGKFRRLRAGDAWYDMTMDLAREAKLKVRGVVLTDLDKANAFVNPFRTVGITQKLIDSLEPDEVKAVIAHELGHIRHQHVPIRILLTLIGLALLFATVMWLRSRLAQESMLGTIVHSPVLFVVFGPVLLSMLFLNRRSQKDELEADRFAVKVLGNADVVIRALIKITDANKGVHSLKGLDQSATSHPSLLQRVRTIMEEHPGSGLFVEEHPSGALLIKDRDGDTELANGD